MPPKQTVAITISADNRRLKADLRRASGELRSFERQVGGVAMRMRRMRQSFMQSGIFGRAGGAVRTAAGFAGAFGFQQLIKDARDYNAGLTDVGITGNLNQRQMAAMGETINKVSNATAKSRNEVLGFVQVVTTLTGDAKGAHVALADMGEIALATGADMNDLAGVFVKLTKNMGIMPSKARAAFNILRSQEKLGSITMANVAQNFGKLAGVGGEFGAEGKGVKGVRAIGGLFQLAGRGFGVGQEAQAAIATEKFLFSLKTKRKQIKKQLGVDVFDAQGKARDLPTVFEEIGLAIAKNPKAKTLSLFGERGVRVAAQLRDAVATGSFDPAAAKLFTAGARDEISADAAKRRASPAFQFDKAVNQLGNTLKNFAMPLFKSLSKTLKEFGPDLVKMLKFVLENSRTLFNLWLGVKGARFFSNLMAPVGGGGGILTSAGQVMGPGGIAMAGGQLAPASQAVAQALGAAGASGARSALSAYPMTFGARAEGFGTNRLTDAQMLRRERTLRGRAGRFAGRGVEFLSTHRGTIGRGAGMGMGLAGAAGMFGTGGGAYGQTANMIASMMLMSGNPALMAAGGAVMVGNSLLGTKNAKGKAGMFEGDLVDPRGFARMFARASGAAMSRGKGSLLEKEMGTGMVSDFLTNTSRGIEFQRSIDKTLGGVGLVSDQLGTGFDAERLLKKRGVGGIKTLKGTLGTQAARLRAKTIEGIRSAKAMRGDKSPITEEQIQAAAGPQLAKLEGTINALERVLVKLLKGEGITVNARVLLPSGSTPAARLHSGAGLHGVAGEYGPDVEY